MHLTPRAQWPSEVAALFLISFPFRWLLGIVDRPFIAVLLLVRTLAIFIVVALAAVVPLSVAIAAAAVRRVGGT